MRTIEWATAFKRDYKREVKTRSQATLDALLVPVFQALAADQPLTARYRDHGLKGNWNGYRECHIKPDLLLIYRLADEDTLRLVRLGSHNALFE